MRNREVIAAINNCIWLTLSERRMLIGLWSFWSSRRKIYARQKYFAENWNIGYSTVRRGLKRFKGWRLINVTPRPGSSSLIEFSLTAVELVEILAQAEPPTIHTEQESNSIEQLDDKNEQLDDQKEQGGLLKNDNHNTEPNTDVNNEENTDSNNVLNSDSENVELNDSNTSFDIGDITYADEVSNDVKHFQELWKKHPRDVFAVFKTFQSDTNKIVVLRMDKQDNSNPFNIHIGETTVVATQTKFDRSKYLVLDSKSLHEIISHYE